MRRLLAVVLILTGLCFLAYPTAREWYFDYRQRQLLKAWAAAQAEAELWPSQEAASEQEQTAAASAPASEPASPDPALERFIQDNTEGILAIGKIDLNIPVLKEDTEENLNISVAHVSGTAGPGEVGNYVVAGHHMRTYGRHFNRLHELAKGDEIKFTGPENVTYLYRVFEVLIVEPEDTWVLLPSGEDKLITLVTCDYSRKPSVRLVVRAKLIP